MNYTVHRYTQHNNLLSDKTNLRHPLLTLLHSQPTCSSWLDRLHRQALTCMKLQTNSIFSFHSKEYNRTLNLCIIVDRCAVFLNASLLDYLQGRRQACLLGVLTASLKSAELGNIFQQITLYVYIINVHNCTCHSIKPGMRNGVLFNADANAIYAIPIIVFL